MDLIYVSAALVRDLVAKLPETYSDHKTICKGIKRESRFKKSSHRVPGALSGGDDEICIYP